MSVILADTTVLNNFAQVGQPDLLRKVFTDLSAPTEVCEELAEGERRGLVPICDWSWLIVIEPTAVEQLHASKLERSVGAGEAACIAILAARSGLLLTDDGPARHLAAALGIEVSGTIGVLGKLLRREILSFEEGDALLQKMRARGYWSPVRSLSEVVYKHSIEESLDKE
jgi:predicted nucleic acid-binding protein